jgi:hypothetical protein
MPDTQVSLTIAELAHNFPNPGGNLPHLEPAVLNRLNAPPAPFHTQHAAAVDAQVVAGGRAISFVITAPNDLDPAIVKSILR